MIERFNERITIQQDAVVADQYGNHRKEWKNYFSCFANALTYSKDEKNGVVTIDERGINFEVRFCSELACVTSSGYRVVFHEEIYNIEAVDMMNWKKKTICLKCRKELRS